MLICTWYAEYDMFYTSSNTKPSEPMFARYAEYDMFYKLIHIENVIRIFKKNDKTFKNTCILIYKCGIIVIPLRERGLFAPLGFFVLDDFIS